LFHFNNINYLAFIHADYSLNGCFYGINGLIWRINGQIFTAIFLDS